MLLSKNIEEFAKGAIIGGVGIVIADVIFTKWIASVAGAQS